jgi:hypothetical protein
MPVKVLSVVFRGKFLDALERAFKKHKLTLAGKLTPLQSPAEFATLLRAAAHRNWVVYAKRPFAGPAQVLTYLSRYTHRIAVLTALSPAAFAAAVGSSKPTTVGVMTPIRCPPST